MRRIPSMRIQRQWVSILGLVSHLFGSQCIADSRPIYHELCELPVDPTVVPDPVVVGDAPEGAALVAGMMTVTVDTPEVTVEKAEGTEVEAEVLVV
jgi:hypothetical protein